MHPALLRTEHRGWSVPARRWTWRHIWHDLLFAHWPVPVEALRPSIPAGLNIEQYGGTAWVGVVPFRMTGVTRRGLPNLPWLSAFPELNVRTYVERDGKPGVWFMSLDAPNLIANWTARTLFHLPYRRARISFTKTDGVYRFRSERPGPTPARFTGVYEPTTSPQVARSGTLEHFLMERYCLYTVGRRGKLYRCEVHHPPWPLQQARAKLDAAELLASHGLRLPGPPAVTHFGRRVDVVVWSLERVAPPLR